MLAPIASLVTSPAGGNPRLASHPPEVVVPRLIGASIAPSLLADRLARPTNQRSATPVSSSVIRDAKA